MKQYVIWLILLGLCCCQNIDYSDFHPESIPLQAGNPSPQYNEVMRNLCDNWHSPISYLKKRGYMPTNIEYAPKIKPKNKMYHKNIEKGENYFFFPDNKEQRPRNSIMLLENDESSENSKNEVLKTEPTVTELPPIEEAKNDTTGIINKVKDKFLSIFSHKNKSDQIEESSFDLEDPEFLENYNDEYEISDRRIFARSVSEKPPKQLNFSNEGILSNLTDTEIHFIKSFINWFKQNKEDFKFLSSTISNITTPGKNSDLKDGEAKSKSSPKSGDTRPTEVKPKVQNSTESEFDKKVPSSTNPVNVTSSECSVVGSDASTTVKTTLAQSIGAVSKNISSTTTGGKDTPNDFTVDLDINQKNGTGEEIRAKSKCPCVQTLSETPIPQFPCFSDRNKYITKSKFLAHLHHMVDEVGKPPHKPLDLAKVQDIIDKSKKIHTATMSGDKTTQCAPLRLNDMSFDLEWNKINTMPHSSREKMNILDLPYVNQPQEQSLAAKFLQDVNSYPGKSDEYLKTPYADNFLDSQQSLPGDLELPLKSSTKREVGLPSFGDISSFPETDIDNENYLAYFEESPKRRIKGRIKGRNKKKPKHKNNTPSEAHETTIDSNDDTKQGTDFNSFDELKDIQFRVNENDEQAISTFISNLNSPPEVFSFDVDKYLRSAKQNMEPKAPEFEFQSPEPRTYYEFLESPAVENKQLPLIEIPSDTQLETVVDKRSRTSPEKRDLLRQYIKGVSSALNHNFDDIYCESCNKDPQDKLQRSPNSDTDITFRTNNLIDGFSTNLDAMDSIKSSENDDSLNSNYFLLNDGSAQDFDVPKQDPEVVPNDYSPQSLEIDLDLDKKFRDLNIGRYNNDLPRSLASVDSKNFEKAPKDNSEVEASDLESINSDPY